MYDIVCVGHLCTDILVKPFNALPEKGKLSITKNFKMQVGGCAANTAIDISKIGLSCALVGKIGTDGFGSFIKQTFENEGVSTNYLNESSTDETSASVVAISDDGERSVVHSFGANATFGFNDIDLSVLDKTKILFIGGALLLPNFDGEGAKNLLKIAKEKGILCCMDTAWDSEGKWIDKIGCSLKYLDWFMPSFEEAVCLANGEEKPSKIADIFMDLGVKNVVIKLGKDGCYVKCNNGKDFYLKGFDNIKAVDTSGAGDSFCAGFLTGLYKGWDIEECARFANAVGTHCVMEIGTTTGIKSMNEIFDFIHSYK